MPKTILLVEDNDKFRRLMKRTLMKEGYTIFEAGTGSEAEKIIDNEQIDVALLDILLPDTTGLKLLKNWATIYYHTAFVMCTAYGDVGDAVNAMKLGAFDYLTKPIKADELKLVMKRTFEWKEQNNLTEQQANAKTLHGMIGNSQQMQHIFELVQRVAPQDVTVLLQGESGTGKSKCAHAIHLESERHENAFVKVNCATIPSHLLESELFGYEKGAFTGATASQKGKCSAADGGTLFLDEIGEIPLDLQAKLLQFTQDKTFTPLGSTLEKATDVRIIAATNRNLWKMVQNGEFREDLYYRLNIIKIELPSLRNRKEDIPEIIQQFLKQFGEEHKRQYSLSEQTLQAITQYDWPGNIRELENALARATVLSSNTVLECEDFPVEMVNHQPEKIKSDQEETMFTEDDFSLPTHLQSIERKVITDALEQAGGNQAQAAELLGISRQSLLYKIKKHEIDFSIYST